MSGDARTAPILLNKIFHKWLMFIVTRVIIIFREMVVAKVYIINLIKNKAKTKQFSRKNVICENLFMIFFEFLESGKFLPRINVPPGRLRISEICLTKEPR